MKKQWRLLSESKNFRKDRFLNLEHTPVMAEGVSTKELLLKYLRPLATRTPPIPLPSVKTDLKALRSEAPVIVWFGHSSYFIHCNGINILVDPVFSGHASPIRTMVKAYPGSNVYQPEDMPAIDYLIVTHNHYDHLDKKTIAKLRPKVRAVYTPLGVGKDIASCCSKDMRITEMDWWETEELGPQISLTATPARHFSGRGIKRGGSLWASFVLRIHGYTIFIGGDSGYGSHFKNIGEQYGPFDIAILECGQYNEAWHAIHMMPEETVQAAIDLKAKELLPVHWSKFTLALHPWNEPIERVVNEAAARHMPILTPKIGEPVTPGQQARPEIWWNL
jgi:L-ascorbate metabolism protein UlaG (beta-lactamase superfamily)